MKLILTLVAALATLTACDALTEGTGLTPAQQACMANVTIAMEADPVMSQWTYAQKAGHVASVCLVPVEAVVL